MIVRAPARHDSRPMRGRRVTRGRRAQRPALFQPPLEGACHTPVPKPVAQRLMTRGKPHNPVSVATARRPATIAGRLFKTGVTGQ